MSTEKTLRITSNGPGDTSILAAHLAKRLHTPAIVVLEGDLGSGKTAFVKAFADSLGFEGEVTSPTFTLHNEYHLPGADMVIHHYDFYRLDEAGVLEDELQEVLADQQGIVFIEWSKIVNDVLPKPPIIITFRVTGEESRQLELTVPVEYSYLGQESSQ